MILLALALLAAPPPSGARGKLALTISGGVSLGSYEAGLTWAIVRYLRASDRGTDLAAVTVASAGAEAAFRDSVAVRGRSSRASEDRVRPPDLRPRFRGCATSSRRASRPLWYRRAPGHPGGARLRGRPVRFPPAPALRLLAPVPRGRNSARRRLRRPRSRSEHHLSLLRGNPAGRLAPAVQAQLQ